MFKKYDHRLVSSYISYTIHDLCRLFRDQKLHPQTIRGWINSGALNSNHDGRKVLIYGGVLKQFLKNRNTGHKRTLTISEFRCSKCRAISQPLENTILMLSVKANGCIIATAMCPLCAFIMHRIYSRNAVPEIKDLFIYEPDALIILSDIVCSLSNAHLQTDQKSSVRKSFNSKSSHGTKKY